MYINPKLNARTIGGTLVDVVALLKSCGNEQGVKCDVIVEGITFADDGSVEFKLLVVRLANGIKKRNSDGASA